MADNENLEDGATEGESKKRFRWEKALYNNCCFIVICWGIGFGAYTFLKDQTHQNEGEVISDEITEDDTAANDNDKPSDKSEKS